MSNPEVDQYAERSEIWPDEIGALRPILQRCGLDEAIKWAKPCYSHNEKNIAIIQEMKGFLALMFFKGALLSDTEGVLHDQGPNSRSARRLQFTSVGDVEQHAGIVEAYVKEAIDIEEAGGEVGPPPELVLVRELQDRLDADGALRAAFDALTPGRRREYHLYVCGAKRASTRTSRVDTSVPKILDGKGLRDR